MEDNTLEDCRWSHHCGHGGQLQRLSRVSFGCLGYTQEIGEVESKGETSENVWPHEVSILCFVAKRSSSPSSEENSLTAPQEPLEKRFQWFHLRQYCRDREQ